MKLYRCKHTVEALCWTDTEENREAFATWFEKHDAMFETRGPEVVLPEPETGTVKEGEWILYSDGEFIAMEDELFTDDYEEVA
jgi:hypothetical protein